MDPTKAATKAATKPVQQPPARPLQTRADAKLAELRARGLVK